MVPKDNKFVFCEKTKTFSRNIGKIPKLDLFFHVVYIYDGKNVEKEAVS